jgi:hypothetical protein
MAEAARAGEAEGGARRRVLVVIIAPNTKVFDGVATGLLDLGVAGTVSDVKGLITMVREEMPVFSGLASMLPETLGSKMILSVTSEELSAEVFEMIEMEFKATERPIAFSIPIERSVGIRR